MAKGDTPEAASAPPVLRARGVSKSFPGVRALDGVDLEVRAGEVHALMGENGAGKSTLIKVLTGLYRRDAGTVELDGRPIAPRSPAEAEAAGISTVYQEVHLQPHLSVAENIMLGRQPARFGVISWRETRRLAREALERVGVELDVRRELAGCSTALQQMVAIARAVSVDARLLVLDEPTSSLDEHEVDELFRVVSRLRSAGLGIVFVTHFLDQVYRIADRITVLRGGKKIGTHAAPSLPRLELIGQMLGKSPGEVASAERQNRQRRAAPAGSPEVLRASGLGRQGSVEPFDLRAHAGEVVGLAGLLGSGRTEALRLCFGLDRATSGDLSLQQEAIKKPTPRKAIAGGAAFCPEDRKREGVLLGLSVRENIVLAMQASRGLAARLPLHRQRQIAEHYTAALKIKTPSTETPVGNLSGGNQQKVLLARWLAMRPKLILLDEPTRGIDIGAKAEIESLVSSLADDGIAIVFVSSELDEVARVCDRVVVMRDRKRVGEIVDGDNREEALMKMIARHDDD